MDLPSQGRTRRSTRRGSGGARPPGLPVRSSSGAPGRLRRSSVEYCTCEETLLRSQTRPRPGGRLRRSGGGARAAFRSPRGHTDRSQPIVRVPSQHPRAALGRKDPGAAPIAPGSGDGARRPHLPPRHRDGDRSDGPPRRDAASPQRPRVRRVDRRPGRCRRHPWRTGRDRARPALQVRRPVCADRASTRATRRPATPGERRDRRRRSRGRRGPGRDPAGPSRERASGGRRRSA